MLSVMLLESKKFSWKTSHQINVLSVSSWVTWHNLETDLRNQDRKMVSFSGEPSLNRDLLNGLV